MISIGPVLATLVLVGGIIGTISTNNSTKVKDNINNVKEIKLNTNILSGIDLAKASILGGEYETLESFYINNKDYGFKYLKNKELNLLLKDYTTNDGTTNIGYKISGNIINVIIETKNNDIKRYIALTFSLDNSNNMIPLVYSGNGVVSGGSMCSMKYNENGITNADMVNPNINLYLDNKFSISPTFTMPSGATNPKNVVVNTNFPTLIQSYQTIDKIYSSGNVSVTNNANVGYIESNGTINVQSGSNVGTKVPNSTKYQYPDMNTTFTDNNFNYTASGKQSITCGTGACKDLKKLGDNTPCVDTNNVTLPSGNYSNLVIGNNCNIQLTGSDYTFLNVDINNNANIQFTNSDVQLKANTIDVKNNSSLTYSGTNPNSYMILSSNTMNLNNNSQVVCKDPRQCLIDTNTYTGKNNSKVQGNILARKNLNITHGTIYGNLMSESMNVSNSQICNILDNNNTQMFPKTYFDIANGNTVAGNKITQMLMQTMCKDISDCLNKFTN